MTSFVKEVVREAPRKMVGWIFTVTVNNLEKIVYRNKIPLTDSSLDQLARSGSQITGREFAVKRKAILLEFLKNK